MEEFVETEKMLKKKFRSRQEKLGRDKGCLMDELTWLQQGELMLRHTSSLKGVLIVTTEIFRSRHRNQLSIEKSCRDRK